MTDSKYPSAQEGKQTGLEAAQIKWKIYLS
jgi:hypothetical protein